MGYLPGPVAHVARTPAVTTDKKKEAISPTETDSSAPDEQASRCTQPTACVKRAKTNSRFGRSRTAKTVETVQPFRLMAYRRFGQPNSDFG